jgi:hypothetical protein
LGRDFSANSAIAVATEVLAKHLLKVTLVHAQNRTPVVVKFKTEVDYEDREAEALERSWRKGIAAMVVAFLVTLGLFWAGIYLFTQ